MGEARTWMITGCAHGIGREIALGALRSGARVIAADIDRAGIREIAESFPDRCLALRLDMADSAEIATAIADAVGFFGTPDVLVNNAAISFLGAIEETPDNVARRIFEVNFHGPAALIRALLPAMRGRRSGTIVNVSSLGGVIGHANAGFYSASKFALAGFSEALRAEVEPFGLRVIVVEPGGGFRTGMMNRTPVAATRDPDYERTLSHIRAAASAGMGREPGDPARAAAAILKVVGEGRSDRRILLGSAAYERGIAHLDLLRTEYQSHEAISRSTDFPAD